MLRAARTCVRYLKYQRIPIRFNSNNSNSDYPEEWLTRAKKEVGGKDPAEALSWTSDNITRSFSFVHMEALQQENKQLKEENQRLQRSSAYQGSK